jgi:putative effector of murein hydrolase/putative effector of murein hydrolase LrgA (UPF0299 family)
MVSRAMAFANASGFTPVLQPAARTHTAPRPRSPFVQLPVARSSFLTSHSARNALNFGSRARLSARRHGHAPAAALLGSSSGPAPERSTVTATPSGSLSKAVLSSAHTLFSLCVYFAAQRTAAVVLPFLPAPLAAMLALLFGALSLRAIGAGKAVDTAIAALFAPGAAFLTRWLAVFFVPNLVLLPLIPGVKGSDGLRIVAVVLAGFAISFFSSVGVAIGLREATGGAGRGDDSDGAEGVPAKLAAQATTTWPPKSLVNRLGAAASVMLTISVALARIGGTAVDAGLVMSTLEMLPVRLYGLILTLLSFCIGQSASKRVKIVFHPLITCTLGTIAGMGLLAVLSNSGFEPTLAGYYIRAANDGWGGGNLLSALLGPAVISFAFQMDSRRKLLGTRFVEIVGTSLIASVIGLFGTAAFARALGASKAVRLMVLPRMVTAPLAIPIAGLLGANVALAATIVAVTGLLGASLAAPLLDLIGVRDPVARGLAAGTSAHGLGTAAMAGEPAAFPFAALAMALVGIFSTLIVSTPQLRALLLLLALGK